MEVIDHRKDAQSCHLTVDDMEERQPFIKVPDDQPPRMATSTCGPAPMREIT